MQASEPVKWSMRDQMPETAKWVDQRRAEWGRGYVAECIRRAIAGEAGFFYAIESGHVLGTPFPAGEPIAEDQAKAVLWGAKFAVFMRPPEGLAGGAH